MKLYRAATLDTLHKVWPLAQPWLAKGYSKGNNIGEFDIVADLCLGRSHLHLLKDGPNFAWFILSVYERYPNRVAVVDNLAGRGVLPLLPAIAEIVTDYARHNACDYIELEGRKGWGRHLEQFGMAEVKRVYRKQVTA